MQLLLQLQRPSGLVHVRDRICARAPNSGDQNPSKNARRLMSTYHETKIGAIQMAMFAVSSRLDMSSPGNAVGPKGVGGGVLPCGVGAEAEEGRVAGKPCKHVQ